MKTLTAYSRSKCFIGHSNTNTQIANMEKSIAIFGDSFIQRLRKFCKGSLKVPGNVYWYGKGGLRTDRMDEHLLNRMIQRAPDVAFICVGGNDISANSTPRQIFQRILDIVSSLSEQGTRCILIAQVLQRGNFSKSPGLTKRSFELQRHKLNWLLAKEFKKNFIKFPDVNFPNDFLPDLVHLSDCPARHQNCGMKKYMCRVQRVLIANTEKLT